MDIKGPNFPNVAEIYANDSKLKKEDVQTMEEWLKTQPHLPKLTENQVILFLHSCYYDLQAAQRTIENYFTFRSSSDIFKNLDEELIRRVFTFACSAFLPTKTPEGDIILLVKIIEPQVDKYDFVEHVKVMLAIMALHCHQYGPANGLILVFDMDCTSLGHLFKINISAFKQLIYFVQDAAPIRLKSINHVNTVPIVGRFVSLARPFMKKEIYKMFKFYYSLDSFYEVVPRECLPQEYGGFLPSIPELQESNLKNILGHLNILEWHNTQIVDESKRRKK